MINFEAIIFDFDGVLLESEFEANVQLAQLLTDLGHRHTASEAMRRYSGLAGADFIAAVEDGIGGRLPAEFHERIREKGVRALKEGIDAVVGAIDFVRSLPAELPKAVASSSSSRWIRGHLDHLGLANSFGDHVYSGREHVTRGKPAPDIYLYAADQLDVAIGRSVILEDSEVGAKGALASGATVIGLAAGRHCLDGHEEMLRSVGIAHVAHSFDEVARLIGLDQTRM
ncbi:MAG TPA: HAD family phosphatase [Sphingomicrobium sp.]|jgi:HAD superfamily hydrolase (TIGR01509 family)|nr:HAD family phosphatase [Sphingomicrobium sp.]